MRQSIAGRWNWRNERRPSFRELETKAAESFECLASWFDLTD